MKRQNIFLLKHNNFIAGLLVCCLLIAMPYATEKFLAKSAQDKKQEAEENLKDVQNEIKDIEKQQKENESQMEQAKANLSNLIEQQKRLKSEIDATQGEIDQTKMDLELAKADAQHQYELMKIRIQYMYENSTGDDVWTALLESDGITDFLNRMEYITTIHNADRELTEQYKVAIALVEEKEQELLSKMDELLAKQEIFLGQQVEMEYMIADLEDAKIAFAEELVAAEAQAAEYRNTIKVQSEIIRQEQLAAANKKPPTYAGGQNVSGQEIVNFAMQFVGNPYVWGGNS